MFKDHLKTPFSHTFMLSELEGLKQLLFVCTIYMQAFHPVFDYCYSVQLHICLQTWSDNLSHELFFCFRYKPSLLDKSSEVFV